VLHSERLETALRRGDAGELCSRKVRESKPIKKTDPLKTDYLSLKRSVAAGPISRILSAGRSGRTAIPLGRALLHSSSDLPGGLAHRADTRPAEAGTSSLFGLAPCGVCPARRITAAAVRSCRTFSPLPGLRSPGGMFSVALSVGRAWTRPPGRYPAHCSAEFGLSSPLPGATVRPSCPQGYYILRAVVWRGPSCRRLLVITTCAEKAMDWHGVDGSRIREISAHL